MAKLELDNAKSSDPSIACIYPVLKSDVSNENYLKEKIGPLAAAWAKTTNFTGESGKTVMIPGADGQLAGVLLGLVRTESRFCCLFHSSPEHHATRDHFIAGGRR